MKSLIKILLPLVIIFTLASCSNTNKNEDTSGTEIQVPHGYATTSMEQDYSIPDINVNKGKAATINNLEPPRTIY